MVSRKLQNPDIVYIINIEKSNCRSQVVSIIEIEPHVFSIQDFKDNKFRLFIHPNPIKEDLNFMVYNATGRFVDVEIYNAIGAILFQSKLELDTNNSNTIALPSLSPGIYFAKIYNEFNQSTVVKFIK